VRRLKPQLVLEEDDGSELGSIVLNVETVLLTLDDGVTPTDRDVIDSHLTLVASSKFEFALVRCHGEQVDVSGRVLVQRHGLEKDVVGRGGLGNFLSQIDNFEDSGSDLESVWVHMFANFTFESLPVEGTNVLGRLGDRLFLLLSQNPTLKALEMNKTHRSLAFTSKNQRIFFFFLCSPANSALNVIFRFIDDIGDSLDLHGLSQLLLVEFLVRHVLLFAPEVLDPKPHSSKLNSIKFLNFVVILSSFILERSRN
jgi:hypothetical protein